MDDNTFKLLSLLLGTISTLGLAFIAYLGIRAEKVVTQAATVAEVQQRRTTSAVQTVASTLAATAADTRKVLAANTDLTNQRLGEVVTTLAGANDATVTRLGEVVHTLADSNSATTERLVTLTQTAQATHTLVNSSYGMSLLATLNALKMVRYLTKDPDDIKEADRAVAEAQRIYDDHNSKQRTVDATTPVGPFPTNVEKPKPIRG